MKEKLLNVGFGNAVVAERIVAFVSPNTSPSRRMREEARKQNMLIDATQGRKTRSLIILDSNHVVLSSIQLETITQRFENLLDPDSK